MAKSARSTLTPIEGRAAVSLAAIYALRMMGLFMILPVFALYAQGNLSGATPMLIGLAIGAYGLTNAVFQLPFGWLSDRYGRKPMITLGLVLFAVGSVVAATGESIEQVILGRALQGSGAIAAAVMALAADLTHEDHRLRVMALIGMSIGLSFSVSLVAGPLLDGWIGVPGIFWLTAVLALLAIVVLYAWVPVPAHSRMHRDAEAVPADIRSVLADRELIRLNVGIFALHLILTATFVAVPVALHQHAQLPIANHWWVYLVVQVLSMGLMVPFVVLAERNRRMKQVFIVSIVLIALAQAGLWLGLNSVWGIGGALLIFFLGFNVLEATLPSLVAKTAPSDKKGTAMGIYSTTQFLGAFVGGASGGWLSGHYGVAGVFVFCTVIALVWAAFAAAMRNPRYLSNHVVNLGPVAADQAEALAARLRGVTGVAEAKVIAAEGMAYLKIDPHQLDRDALAQFSAAPAAGP